jgi:hypothetical protein
MFGVQGGNMPTSQVKLLVVEAVLRVIALPPPYHACVDATNHHALYFA